MEIAFATNIDRVNKARIEGPTAKQAVAMAARLDFVAFELDCEAFDIEGDLITYGFDPATGQRRPR